ncbi:hypothetical protein LP414_28645 [Polaromonas sp. P1(28)-13]|nr:hypothetical protein LP417_27615 [Polaromonas sp. P1-6]UUZ75634.1 hypothetical protein LP414_28645 [Polaromonas sp. P1(28)-13]
MNIHQVSVSYVSEQDRLLLRINTRDGEELRLWFTRRLTLSLLPVLNTTSADQMKRHTAQASPAAPLEVQRQRMLESFQQEAAAYDGDYASPYQEQAQMPALAAAQGIEPMLISEVKITLRAAGQLQLQMFEKLPDQTRNAQVMMDPSLTQGLLHLLNQALKKSQWLELPSQAAGLEASASADANNDTSALPDDADRPKYLN